MGDGLALVTAPLITASPELITCLEVRNNGAKFRPPNSFSPTYVVTRKRNKLPPSVRQGSTSDSFNGKLDRHLLHLVITFC